MKGKRVMVTTVLKSLEDKRKFKITKYEVEKFKEEGGKVDRNHTLRLPMYELEVDGNGSGERTWFYEEGVRYDGKEIITPIKLLADSQFIEL